MRFIDAHNHLQDAWLAPHLEQVLNDLEGTVDVCVVNGTAESDWVDVASLCSPRRLGTGTLRLLGSYGLHPWYVGNASPHWRERLVAQLDAARGSPTGVGEIGLDRWMLERARPDDSRLAGLRRATLDEQQSAFEWQVRLAAERNLPLTIHCLDAWGPLGESLRRVAPPARGFLLHAFGGSIEVARDLAAKGAYFSFNGYFLGDRQAAKRAVFKSLPLDRLLVETDAPAMPLPAVCRRFDLPGLADGNPINHPANIAAVYAGLAQIRELPVDELAAQIERNFRSFFEREA